MSLAMPSVISVIPGATTSGRSTIDIGQVFFVYRSAIPAPTAASSSRDDEHLLLMQTLPEPQSESRLHWSAAVAAEERAIKSASSRIWSLPGSDGGLTASDRTGLEFGRGEAVPHQSADRRDGAVAVAQLPLSGGGAAA